MTPPGFYEVSSKQREREIYCKENRGLLYIKYQNKTRRCCFQQYYCIIIIPLSRSQTTVCVMGNAEFGIGFHLYTSKYNWTPTTAGDKTTKMHTIRQQCVCNRRSVPAAKKKKNSSYIADPHKKVSHSAVTTHLVNKITNNERDIETIITIINRRVK